MRNFNIAKSDDGSYIRASLQTGNDPTFKVESFWFHVMLTGEKGTRSERWVWTLYNGPYQIDSGNRGTDFAAIREAVERLKVYIITLYNKVTETNFQLWYTERKVDQRQFIDSIPTPNGGANGGAETDGADAAVPVDTEV